MSKDDSKKSRSRIEKQAIGKVDEGADVIELITELDLSPYQSHGDTYDVWHASYPFEAMLRVLYLKELMGYSDTDLHRRLTENLREAEALGLEEVPSRTTFGRTWRNRLSREFRNRVQHTTHRILEYSKEQGNPIGLQAIEPEEKANSSPRTQDRFINRKAKEVTEEMQRLVFPAFEFNRAENAHYDSDAFYELQGHLGLSSSAAESGTDLFSDDTIREDLPDADTHLHNIKRLDPEKVQKMVDEGICRMVTQARQHLQFNRPVDVAIDMTYVPYYGDRDELEMVMGAPGTKSYGWCYKFATLTVVGENVKFTLAMRPVQKGDLVGEIVRDLLRDAREHVSISTAYADSEFCSVDSIRALEGAGVRFVIPSPKNKRVKREIGRMKRDIEVREGYAIYGSVSGGGTQERAAATLVLLPSMKDEESTVAFMTNKDVKAGTETERKYTKRVIERYSRRWGIENSYKTIKEFLAWTTSKDFTVRLFYFGFAVLLYNMWLLVYLLVQLSLDIKHRYKPRVTAKRFLDLARKQLSKTRINLAPTGHARTERGITMLFSRLLLS